LGALIKWELSLSDEADINSVLRVPLIISPIVLPAPSKKQLKKNRKKERSSSTEKEVQKEC